MHHPLLSGLGLRLCAILLFSAFTNAHAGTLKLLLDTDNDPTTGCAVLADGQTFSGAESILFNMLDEVQAEVTAVALAQCQDATENTFSEPEPVSSTAVAAWPIGQSFGLDGADVLETMLPEALGDTGEAIRFGVVLETGGGTVTAAVFDAVGDALEIPALITGTAVPTLSIGAVLALMTLVAWRAGALRKNSRRYLPMLVVCSPLSATACAGIFKAIFAGVLTTALVIAAVTLDGLPDDWEAPAIYTAAPGSSDPIRAVFARRDNEGAALLRVDAVLTPPSTACNLTGDCDVNALCTDFEDPSTCYCPIGFLGDGLVCNELDLYPSAVAAGSEHTCALLSSGAVRCWGLGTFGRLGYASSSSFGGNPGDVPALLADIDLGFGARAVAAGGSHTCALSEDGRVRCWGRGTFGQLGYGNSQNIGDDESPVFAGDVPVGGVVTALAAGLNHTCALLEDASVKCWGLGSAGALGYGSTVNIGAVDTPAAVGAVDLGGRAVQIAAGDLHTCALREDGAVLCWGFGTGGRLGYGNVANIGDDETPASVGPISLGQRAVDIAAGSAHTCAVLEDGSVRCWGDGQNGRLGLASTTNVGDTPARLPDMVPTVSLGGAAQAVTAGSAHTCVRMVDGAVRCFGLGGDGRLGLGNTVSVGDNELPDAVPPIGFPGRVLGLEAGGAHTCALLADATYCWGQNQSGQLGLGTTADLGDNEDADLWPPVDVTGF